MRLFLICLRKHVSHRNRSNFCVFAVQQLSNLALIFLQRLFYLNLSGHNGTFHLIYIYICILTNCGSCELAPLTLLTTVFSLQVAAEKYHLCPLKKGFSHFFVQFTSTLLFLLILVFFSCFYC